MSETRNIVAVIPARCGSKRLPHKNRLKIRGLSLFERTVNAARATRKISRVILTTDDSALIDEAERIGQIEIYKRPPHLAEDKTSSEAVIADLIPGAGLENSVIILLQLTSPFRTGRDIDGLLEEMEKRKANNAVSVTRWRPPPSPPFGAAGNLEALGVRQTFQATANCPDVVPDQHWAINGAIYAFNADEFMTTGKFYDQRAAIFPMENWRSIDIDYEDDYQVACALAEYKNI